jgi:hydrogenase-4 component B
MRLPMAVLLLSCVVIGLYPAGLLPLLTRAVADWQPGALSVGLLAPQMVPATALSVCALLLLGLLALAAWLLRQKTAATAAAPTWGCGYAFPTSRMQYSAASFAEMLTGLFRWGLRPERHGGEVSGLFPAPAAFETHTPDTVLDRLLYPLFRSLARGCTRLRARVQHGITGFYLLYVALTLCLLLAMVARLRGGP